MILIFGNKSTAIEISEHCFSFKLVYYDENWKSGVHNITPHHYIISFTDFDLREKLLKELETDDGFRPMSVWARQAYVSNKSIIRNGTFIAPMAVVSSGARIGKHCIIHYGASIGHDAVLDDNVIVLPGARVSGNVHIKSRTLIGSNAFIYQGVKIGSDNIVDALTYIRHDLPDNKISFGRNTKTFERIK
jgi:carbonic anhydrase/acetyltransferase-like protein (isoleucine patch superfamily)